MVSFPFFAFKETDADVRSPLLIKNQLEPSRTSGIDEERNYKFSGI